MSSPFRLSTLWLLLLACAAVCVALSSQSFWIDETESALKAAAPTFHAWWQGLYNEGDSNIQLPLYMLYIWGLGRLIPISELSLRAANIPFFFLGFFAIHHFLRRRQGLRSAALLIYCVHPFVWYYLDEARPYLMQLSGAMLAAGALFAALDLPGEPLQPSWWWLYGAGLFIMCGSGMLGIPWAAAITLLLIVRRPGFLQSTFRQGLPALLLFIPLLACLTLYFAWTVKQGFRNGETGSSPASIPFVFYEDLGFNGLGPGRADMRARSLHVFLPYIAPACILGIPLCYALARAAAVRFGLSSSKFLAICLAVCLPAGFVFALGFAKGFLVLGRHMTPLFPFVLCAVAFSISHLWRRRNLLDRAAAVLIVIALAISSLEIRFASRHQKDDYKDAAAIAIAALAQSEDVWWVADPVAGEYYSVPVSQTPDSPAPATALYLWKALPADLVPLPPPTLVVLSKPDIFDTNSAVLNYLKQNNYTQFQTLPAFTLWKK